MQSGHKEKLLSVVIAEKKKTNMIGYSAHEDLQIGKYASNRGRQFITTLDWIVRLYIRLG
jgi:hypothetical protein